MKKFIFFARVCFVVLYHLPLSLEAQEVDSFPNYVVIGAFAYHKNAVNFSGDANQNKFPARFEMNPNRNLYYVYVLSTPDRAYAIAEAVRLRAETKYFDTWVYSGPLGTLTLANGKIPEGEDINPLTGHAFQSPVTQSESRSGPSPSPPSEESEDNPTPEVSALKGNLTPGVNATATSPTVKERTSRRSRREGRSANNPAKQPVHPDPQQTAASLETAPNEQAKKQSNAGTDASTWRTSQPLRAGAQPDDGAPGKATQSSLAEKNAVNPGVDGGQGIRMDDGANGNDAKTVANASVAGNTETVLRDQAQEDQAVDNVALSSARLNAAETSDSGQESQPDPRRTSTERSATSDGARPGDAMSRETLPDDGARDIAHAAENTPPGRDGSTAHNPPPKRVTTEPLKPEEVLNKSFYFHLFRADNASMVEGEVDAIDFLKSRKMATYPGNTPVAVKMPSGKMQHVSFLCQVFGYRKQQKEFDPAAPDQDLYLDDKGNIVVPFELIRLQKGDIAIMYNVFFFKDAAVMRPESRYEVINLLALLEENPSYEIVIHGHTNGNAGGKIIRMGTPGNFYSLSGTKQGFGSAKKLSEERASVMREFLISSGISPERMKIRAWGGKKPIHDTRSARAHENVRVEIEILPD